MNPERLLNTFFELVRIDSPSLREGAVAAYCKTALEQAGCTVRFDDSAARTGSDTGNLIATLPARVGQGDRALAPSPFSALFFSAHMDTVTPAEGIEPVVADGVITSAGETVLGGDDKAGVAAIIELVRVLAEGDAPHPEIGVLLSVGEEIGLLGAREMTLEGFNGEPCFVLDANGSPGVVIIGAPYHYLFTATFTGKAAHAGIEPEKGTSAIVLASEAVAAMDLGRLDEHTTANVGTITGGSAFNIVADSCVVTGETRALDKQRVDEVNAQITAACTEAVQGTEGSVSIEWEEEYRGFKADENDPLVQHVLGAARSLGLPAQVALTGGGSDANVFAEKGLRPLVLGTGMTDVHSPNESLAVKDLEDLARLCIAITQ
ncbi:MAG: M20/M25/M40 family metallo-hydrolase [Coriobacteriales bacterium]|jgi:tripeptide aminopeptidase|nr:M20/M25/M40 family metallo-hydrolase [Coriobacteriales bacterium]